MLLVLGVSTFGHGQAPTLSPSATTNDAIRSPTGSSTDPSTGASATTHVPADPDSIVAPTSAAATEPASATDGPGVSDPTASREPAAPDEPANATSTPGPATVPDPPAGSAPGHDGCTDARSCSTIWRDGIVERDGRRFAIGEPGDEIVLADADCGGPAAPVVLRPTTGEVFVFDAWADEQHETVARVEARTEPGTHLVPSVADEQGCSPVRVQHADGSISTVLERRPPASAVPATTAP